jgi:HlyD family secretion protein
MRQNLSRKRSLVLAGLGALGLALAGVAPLAGPAVQAKEYVTAPVEHATIVKEVRATGGVRPSSTVRVTASAEGTIAWLGAAPGTRVRRGEVVARIAPAEVVETPAPGGTARPDAAPAPTTAAPADQSAAARKAADEARKRRDAAQAEATKMESLREVVPRLQIEAAQAEAKAAAAAYELAAARLAHAEKASGAATRRADPVAAPRAAAAPAPGLVAVTANVDGVVVSRNVATGESVSKGTAVVTIAETLATVEVRVPISSPQSADVREGMEATATIGAVPSASFRGRVAEVGHAFAIVEIANPDQALRPGMRAEVTVPVARREGVLTVPNAALSFEPDAALGADARPDSAAVVWVQTADGELAARVATVGLSDGERTEIVSGAIAQGDLVVTAVAGAEPPAPIDVAHAAAAPGVAFEMTPEVERLVRFYRDGAGRVTAEAARSRSEGLRHRAEEIFREENVPAELVAVALVESAWHSAAVSPVGAAGIWQFMPATAERFGLVLAGGVDERYDFEKATRAAAQYLRWLADRYDGDWELAVGAYNCGEGAMDRAIESAGGARDFWLLARTGRLPEETANYVPAVLAATMLEG